MFADLFVPPTANKKTPPTSKPKPVKKPKKKTIIPSAAEQTADFGPFEHVVEGSPEATLVENALEYEDIDVIIDEEWPEECCSEAGSEINYEATSVDMSVDECDVGSMTSSPGFFKRKSVDVEKARPPGISLTFDDDSWID
jgi:hypothetical protein